MATKRLRPVAIRHNTSGVWLGYLRGPGSLPDTIEVEGRRVWMWKGGRVDTSQLAKQGVREGDRLGEWEIVEIGSISTQLVELRTIDAAVVEAAKEFPSDGQ